MQDFNVPPFNYIPLANGDLFDLTSEYMLSVLQRIHRNFDNLFQKSAEITASIPDGDFDLYKNCFWSVESIIDDYSKLIKCSKLSLGQSEGEVTSPQAVFQAFTFSPDLKLQAVIIRGLRNTSQHFEERLQVYHLNIDPFLRLSYDGGNLNWEIRFGKGGYSHSGNTVKTIEHFNEDREHTFSQNNLHFHSYQRDRNTGTLSNKDITIVEVYQDVMEIQKLLSENIKDRVIQLNISPSTIRSISVFGYQS